VRSVCGIDRTCQRLSIHIHSVRKEEEEAEAEEGFEGLKRVRG
jgi:hypothetical protein